MIVGVFIGFVFFMERSVPHDAILFPSCAAGACYAILTGVLLAVRGLGYRLAWGRPSAAREQRT
jgi:hypothetical protein